MGAVSVGAPPLGVVQLAAAHASAKVVDEISQLFMGFASGVPHDGGCASHSATSKR
jgi:hypothetical protein